MISHPIIKQILFNHKEIITRIKILAKIISQHYKNNKKPLIIVGLLKGCIPFLSELILHLTITCEIEFMCVSSYKGEKKSITNPVIVMDIKTDINNRDLLIVEDIIDSGATLKVIKEYLFIKGAKTVKVITLLDKPLGRTVKLNADWVGFNVPNEFLIGYGLDYKECFRNLPYIASTTKEKLDNFDLIDFKK